MRGARLWSDGRSAPPGYDLAAAATVAGSSDWRLRLGYAGMEVDGDVEHGAELRLQARF